MAEPILMQFQDQPFNGDTFVEKEFLELKSKYSLNVAVETGSCLFTTTKWLGENFDKVFTCEINPEYASHGFHKVASMSNVNAFIGMDSVQFIREKLHLDSDDKAIFFLDAHWGNNCPLLNEIEAIAGLKQRLNLSNPPIIVIHDFYTGDDTFGYDTYNDERFEYEFIRGSLLTLELAFNHTYNHYYNVEAVGAKRGVIYLFPQTKIQL